MLKTRAGDLIEVGAGKRFLRRRQVQAVTGLSRSTIYQWIEIGRFPKPVALGPRSVGWLQSEIEAWMAARIAARRSA